MFRGERVGRLVLVEGDIYNVVVICEEGFCFFGGREIYCLFLNDFRCRVVDCFRSY